MFIKLVVVLIALGGGLVVGGALAAFLTLIKLVPRLVQLTETRKSIKLYEYSLSIGSLIFIIFYFSELSLKFSNILTSIFSLMMGIFVGLFSSALAEVLNVIPVLTKKLKVEDEKQYIIYTLTLGKVAGSLYFWLYY
ncbi:MAG TPA: stage V sporulation protein AB [Tissierellaceae bacterium]|nr:stage V sporulation protein AB [Tissierellaceae bacterium]